MRRPCLSSGPSATPSWLKKTRSACARLILIPAATGAWMPHWESELPEPPKSSRELFAEAFGEAPNLRKVTKRDCYPTGTVVLDGEEDIPDTISLESLCLLHDTEFQGLETENQVIPRDPQGHFPLPSGDAYLTLEEGLPVIVYKKTGEKYPLEAGDAPCHFEIPSAENSSEEK